MMGIPNLPFTWGWIPWKKGYGGIARAVQFSNGVVYRVGAGNVIYPVSEHLTKRFVTEVPAHPAKALIEGKK